MNKVEFEYLSANGTSTICGVLWEPEGPPRAVIQIAHGITEHMGRYEEFARYFTDRGYAVAGHDQLGHGRSMDPARPMYFGPRGSWRYVVEDVKSCALELKARYRTLPHCLLGFSLGSFAVRTLLGEWPDVADLTVWAGTGQTTGVERAIAKAVVALEEKRFGEEGETPLLRKLTMDTYNKRFQPCRTGADWLCANGEALDEYLADPLCGGGFTVSSFRELLTGMSISASLDHVKQMDREMPILLLSGQDDPVGSCGKGPVAIEQQLNKLGFRDVERQLFAGMRHDLFREKERELVFQTLEEWLEKRLQNLDK